MREERPERSRGLEEAALLLRIAVVFFRVIVSGNVM
jgi:hypothetical protein